MDPIFLSILISTTLLSGIFLITWVKIDRQPHVLCWALAYIFVICNILLNASNELFPDRDIYWVIVNTCSYIAQFLGVAGFFYRAHINPFQFRFICYFIVVEVLLITLTVNDIHYGLKIGLTPLSGFIVVWVMIWVIYNVNRPLRVPEKGIIIIYGLFSLAQLSAGIIAIMQGYSYDKYYLDMYLQVNFLFLGPLFVGSGMFAVMIIADDLATKIKQQMLKIESTNRKLEKEKTKAIKATEAKSQFLANMSHEIRTPMNAVLGMSYLTMQTSLSEQQKSYVKHIQSSAEGLLSVISDVLTLSKIEAGSSELIEENVSLIELITSSFNVLDPLAKQKGITLECHLSEGLPEYVIADKGKIKQVLINLVGNAIKFTPKGSVKISCHHQTLKKAHQITFEVQDTGIGIAEENLTKVCNAFTQIDDHRTRDFEGTGLGLKISHQLIALMGGQLEVSSVVEVGSCFYFTLTLNEGSQDSNQANNIELPYSSSDKIHGAKVLIADDHQTNRLLLSTLLEQVAMTVVQVENGQAALQACQQESFDIIFLDINMPILNGYQTTEKIRALAQYQTTPILAITANAFDTDRSKALNAGMTEYLTKPIRPEDLYQKLTTWCYIPDDLFRNNIDVSAKISQHTVLTKPAHIQPLHYQKMLKAFVEDHQDDIARMQTAISEINLPLWKHVLHGLRGCTGNIGASRLYTELVQLNEKTVPEVLSEQLIRLFTATINEIDKLIEDIDHSLISKTISSNEDLNLMISDLITLMQQNSFNFHEILFQLKRSLPLKFEKDAQELQQNLEAFEFESAVNICLKIQQALDSDTQK